MKGQVCTSESSGYGIEHVCKELSIVLIFLSFSTLSEGKTGYGLDVTVSNSTMSSHWSRSQVTSVLNFQYTGSCTGNGNHSKFHSISGFTGIGLKETGYANTGKLIDKSAINIKSEYRKIYIEQTGDEESKRYTARIEEDLPTSVYSSSDLYYKGAGIRSRNVYANNGENIYTEYYGTTLTKTTRFGSTYRDALILAEVTPASVRELVLNNRTLAFRVQSKSDRYSSLRVSTPDKFLDQDYRGEFDMEAKIVGDHRFYMPDLEDDWISCCSSEDSSYDIGLAAKIFGVKS